MGGGFGIPHASGDEPYLTSKNFVAKLSIPHASGDEPKQSNIVGMMWNVYPTRVGMNRNRTHVQLAVGCIPHASGDEPVLLKQRIRSA